MILARVVSEPANEPISLEEAYRHLRVDPVDSDGRPDDDLILGLITAARQYCEEFTGRALALAEFEAVLDAWPEDDVIELPHPPFVSLLAGISISDDVSDNEIDEDSYTVDSETGTLATISPVTTWPVLGTGNRIRIRYRAGYGDESEAYGAIPRPIKQAMLLLIGHWYANREAVGDANQQSIPLGVDALLQQSRIRLGFA